MITIYWAECTWTTTFFQIAFDYNTLLWMLTLLFYLLHPMCIFFLPATYIKLSSQSILFWTKSLELTSCHYDFQTHKWEFPRSTWAQHRSEIHFSTGCNYKIRLALFFPSCSDLFLTDHMIIFTRGESPEKREKVMIECVPH